MEMKAEDVPDDLVHGCLDAPWTESLQSTFDPALDGLVALQPTAGGLKEIRSLFGGQVRGLWLYIRGSFACVQFNRTGETEDMNRAIECWVTALALLPNWDRVGSEIHNNLGVIYRMRFERLGEVSDLNEAIICGSQALSLAPNGHPSKLIFLNNLGLAYSTRFKHLGEMSDLNEAIASGSQSVSFTHDGHTSKPRRLSNLTLAYWARFRRLGEMSDLNEAIASGSQAVLLTSDGHCDKPTIISNLGVVYAARFERLGEISDLNEAIACESQAVFLTPDGNADKPRYLSNLGVAYSVRFERLGEISDLNEAIVAGSQAVLLTSDSHINKPAYLTNLGASYTTRFERLGEISDLNEAIANGSQSVSLTSNSHPEKPGRLSNLGIAYRNRFERLGEIPDLNKAIARGSKAVSFIPNGHPDVSTHLFNLGLSYKMRFVHLGRILDLHAAKNYFKKAAQSPNGVPSRRFMACREWARFSLLDDMDSPQLAYQQAMELLPQLVWIGCTLGRRYEIIEDLGDFATEAASHAISDHAHDLALEWLEAGRSIIWGQIAQLRTPFDDLFSKNPELATRLKSLACQLEQAGSRSSSHVLLDGNGRDLNQEASDHIKLALDWDRLLDEARSIPGFEDFLRTPKSSRLLSAAQSHPIAVINAHQFRCDALILQPNSKAISHVPLPKFSINDALNVRKDWVSLVGLRELVRDNRVGPHEGVMRTLWTGVVEPVLDFLDYKHKLALDELPQITWCTTGLLSFLPLHAAGCYDQMQLSAFDRVVSSYTPTLSSLLAAQCTTPEAHPSILAVSQEHTPGLSRLPYTKFELEKIGKIAPEDRYTRLEHQEATVERVLTTMDRSSWVHMACHGTQNTKDPTESAFCLYDGHLTLATITKRSFTNKGLAFLSACQTAAGDRDMPDEAVHLAAGMLMAGFPSVIGTMWSIADQDGPEVADLVYKELMKEGKMDHTKAAKALHYAVAELRKKSGRKAIQRWAPFIHFGA